MKHNKDSFKEMDKSMHLLYVFLIIGGIIFSIFLYLLSQVKIEWLSWIL